MIRSLDRLLRPRTIAVFGGRAAHRVIEQCDRMGFAGEIWPVHPSHAAISGRPAFRTVADLPGAPDAAFVGVNRTLTVALVGELARRGAGGAVCYASGFREAAALDGASGLQDALVAAAGAMPIVGPNCYGLINAMDAAPLWPDQHGLRRVPGGVAIVTQSSNIAITLSMQMRGLPIAYLLTAGNQAQTGLSALAAGVLEDPRVTAIGLHVEGFDDVALLERLAFRARALRKPIVALKVGRSEAASAAAISHTASLAGHDPVSAALLARLGIGRARSICELIETLKLLHVHGPLDGFDIASISCSGGEAALMADAAEGRRVRFRPLTPAEAAPLHSTLGAMVAVANPLDYHTFIWGDRARMTGTFAAMMRAGFALTFFVLDPPRADRCDPAEWLLAVAALTDAARQARARAALVATLPETLPEALAAALIADGIAPLCGFDEALAAAEIAAEIGAAWARPEATPLLGPQRAPACAIETLDEHTAKRLLSAAGLRVPEGEAVAGADAAVAAARRLGYPVALKALGVAHKTEVGAVRLALHDDAELRAAHAAMAGSFDRFRVEAMAPAPVAELIVGIARDPVAGLVLGIGAGGILVELLRDTATLTLPAARPDVEAALAALAVHRLMTGFRGGPRADSPAAVDAVMAVQDFAVVHADRLEDLDINPLFVLAEGAGVIAVDALLRMRGADR